MAGRSRVHMGVNAARHGRALRGSTRGWQTVFSEQRLKTKHRSFPFVGAYQTFFSNLLRNGNRSPLS
jgi:hypothetical protein